MVPLITRVRWLIGAFLLVTYCRYVLYAAYSTKKLSENGRKKALAELEKPIFENRYFGKMEALSICRVAYEICPCSEQQYFLPRQGLGLGACLLHKHLENVRSSPNSLGWCSRKLSCEHEHRI